MEKNKKSDQALKFLCRGLLLLVNILVFLFIIFILFHACKAFYNFGYEIYGPVVVEEAPGTAYSKCYYNSNRDCNYK